ncbi:MAG TPA: 5'-nucleotidase, partial [Bacteroidales bacterium]|nr:5'-nucleotidase [Bacteroidales bacterium]
TGFDLICDEINDPAGSNLGPMVADAIYYYVGRIDPEGTDVALIATGLIRDKIAAGKKGYQSVSDIFRVVSLGEGADGIPGYPLAKVYVTGRELKNVFEVLLIAPKSSSSNYCYYAGVKVYYNPKGGFLNKITRIEIRGNEIDYSKNNTQLYGLVANSYMLEFVSLIKKLTYGLLSVYPKHANGDRVSDMKSAWIDFDKSTPGVQEGKEWFALLSFFESFEDCDGDKIPDIPEHYRKAHINIMEEPTGK